MTSTLSCAHKSCSEWCFHLTGQRSHPTEGIIVPQLSMVSLFLYPSCFDPISLFPTSHFREPSHWFSQSSPSSPPACFYIPSAFPSTPTPTPPCQSLHPSAHCVMSLLCESELFVWQPKCNATPLTWESQQSVVLVRETCLEAAVPGFSLSKWALWQSWNIYCSLAHFTLLQLHVFLTAEEHDHSEAGFKCLNTHKKNSVTLMFHPHWVLADWSAFFVVCPGFGGIVDASSA